MAKIYNKFKNLLPNDQSQSSNKKRNSMWEKWDTNNHGFLKLEDIEDGLHRQFQFSVVSNISFVVNEAYKKVRETLTKSVFGPNYLQKKQFRFFISFLDKFIEKMLIFQGLDSNKDGNVQSEDIKRATKLFKKWNLEDIKIVEIQSLSSSNQLDLGNFLNWISNITNYNINDFK